LFDFGSAPTRLSFLMQEAAEVSSKSDETPIEDSTL
jgi:hypothetical protein